MSGRRGGGSGRLLMCLCRVSEFESCNVFACCFVLHDIESEE